MKGVFGALAILALAAGGAGASTGDFARADSSNLAGGVMIAHYPTGMSFTNSEVCEYYAGYALTSYLDQVNRIDAADGTEVQWFVISAWGEPKKFCGVEFGIGNYDELGFGIDANVSGACGTGFDPLEIPNGAWPAPGTGISLATSAGPWRGNYVPIYYFSGYVYTQGTKLEIVANPTDNPFAGWANCDTPPVPALATCLGAMGIGQAGTFCTPEVNPAGACCFGGGDCQILSHDDCDAAGGAWDGSPVCVEPNPCPVIWACCTHDEATGVETCQMLTQNDCSIQSGIWHSGSACGVGGFTCPLIRACCVDQSCTLTTQELCTTSYQGNWLSGTFSCVSPSNPCLFSRACCIGADCQVVTLAECNTLGGFWLSNIEACGPGDVCPVPLRACCFGNDCQLLVELDCAIQEGVWMADEEACLPGGLCPVPAETTTWGSIKAIYR